MSKLKIVRNIIIAVCVALFIGILSFYLLIVAGLSEKLQSTWVCTAMTTLNHKYLATMFFSDEKIDEIMKKNLTDDSELNTDIYEIEKEDTDYTDEGYEMLEDGIYVKEVSGSTWHGNVMLIEDPMRVKLVDSYLQYERGQTVKGMVEYYNAIAGINAGGFVDGPNYDSNGGVPAGLLIENGLLVNPKEPDSEKIHNMIGINKDGLLILNHCTSKWALDNDIVSAVEFTPFIIVNGEPTKLNGTGGWGIAPRTAIGQRKSGEFLFVVVDGRQVGWSIGCDIDVLQQIMIDEKAENASMLDGGSSTVLYYKDDYINKPSLGHERYINNAFIVTKKSEE